MRNYSIWNPLNRGDQQEKEEGVRRDSDKAEDRTPDAPAEGKRRMGRFGSELQERARARDNFEEFSVPVEPQLQGEDLLYELGGYAIDDEPFERPELEPAEKESEKKKPKP